MEIVFVVLINGDEKVNIFSFKFKFVCVAYVELALAIVKKIFELAFEVKQGTNAEFLAVIVSYVDKSIETVFVFLINGEEKVKTFSFKVKSGLLVIVVFQSV